MIDVRMTNQEAQTLWLTLESLVSDDALGDTYLANGQCPRWERTAFLSDLNVDTLKAIMKKVTLL